jgi:hypothetical protein
MEIHSFMELCVEAHGAFAKAGCWGQGNDY